MARHNCGIWNGVWSDQFIDSSFMRFGHSTGGIIRFTLKAKALKIWALSRHICCKMESDIQADAKYRVGLHQKLDSCIYHMDPEGHPDGSIVNIVSRKLAPASVNVDKAVIIGQAMLEDFVKAWSGRFHCTKKWEHGSIMQICSDWWLSRLWSQCHLLTGHCYLVTETLMRQMYFPMILWACTCPNRDVHEGWNEDL